MTITRITQYPLQFVVAFGDAFNGVSLHGPFTDSGDALDWAELHRDSDAEFNIVPIQHAHQPEDEDACQHEWAENGSEQHHGEGRVYCQLCGADGDA